MILEGILCEVIRYNWLKYDQQPLALPVTGLNLSIQCGCVQSGFFQFILWGLRMPCSLRQLSSGHKKHLEVSILYASIKIYVKEPSKKVFPFYPPIKKWICSERFFWPPEIRCNPINLSILFRRSCPLLKYPITAAGSFPKHSAISFPLYPYCLKLYAGFLSIVANHSNQLKSQY